MPDFIVSRMQNRRGLQADLPQPLRVGEFGWCLDTRRLYIGADPNQTLPGVQIFPGFFVSAPATAAVQILQIAVDNTFVFEDFVAASGFAADRFSYEESSTNVFMYIEDSEVASFASIQSALLAIDSVLSVTQGVALVLDETGSASLATHELANAVAYLLNAEAATAVATTKINVEVLTESSQDDIFVTYSLPPAGSMTSVTGLSFPTSSTTAIKIVYSLAIDDIEQFSETGTLLLAARPDLTSVTVSADSVSDGDAVGAVIFDAEISSGTLQIRYINTFAYTVTLKVSTKNWLNL